MSRPQGRGAATTAAIETAALNLVLENGYENVTVDMICDAAEISQRTFFNHFPTKDDALLGHDMPAIDERAARKFVLSSGPLLVDALSLIGFPTSAPPMRIEDRMRAISSAPSLMTRQMERITALEAELREIVEMRLEHNHPEQTGDERRAEAAMVTSLLAGIIRFAGTTAANHGADVARGRTQDALELVLRDSVVDGEGNSSDSTAFHG